VLPTNGTDEDYQQLQQEMDHLAPNVSNLAWGHKYFHLLFPEKLDDFHNPDLQRFHLIKLLQLPPHGKGRYILGGRFVAIASNLSLPMYQLTSLLNIRDGRAAYSYWYIGMPKDHSWDSWSVMRDSSCIVIALPEIGNLSGIAKGKTSKRSLQLDSLFNDVTRADQGSLFHDLLITPAAAGKTAQQITAQQIWDFKFTINTGDLVLACDEATVLGIGRVIGEY